MRGRPPAIEEAAGCENKGSGADTGHAPGRPGPRMQPGEQVRLKYDLPKPILAAAGEDDRIKIGRQLFKPYGLAEDQSAGRTALHRPTCRGSEQNLIRQHPLRQMEVRYRKYLHRSDDIERLNAVITDDGDAPRGMSRILHWRKMRYLCHFRQPADQIFPRV